ncbi:MAG: serine/threonine protein phosphatase [Desulfovibrionales bacterium GWA2_65_9]|nr:MAG: serine/threonine protein phosphatase [Desulfovibrionales bacterium GWA2_65_9]
MYWIAVGDVHESTGVLESIPGIHEAKGLILTGDLTNRGREDKARRVLDLARKANPTLLAQMGNMDHPEVGELLVRSGANIHRQARLLAPGLVLMGVGWSTPTPFGTPSEVPEAELVRWLDETHRLAQALAARDGAAGGFHLVATIHTPPLGTTLDRTSRGVHVGSAGVRAFIEKAQPEVVICGHIHEAVGEEHLGRSHVLNPGLLAEGGYVRLGLTNGQLRASLERV